MTRNHVNPEPALDDELTRALQVLYGPPPNVDCWSALERRILQAVDADQASSAGDDSRVVAEMAVTDGMAGSAADCGGGDAAEPWAG